MTRTTPKSPCMGLFGHPDSPHTFIEGVFDHVDPFDASDILVIVDNAGEQEDRFLDAAREACSLVRKDYAELLRAGQTVIVGDGDNVITRYLMLTMNRQPVEWRAAMVKAIDYKERRFTPHLDRGRLSRWLLACPTPHAAADMINFDLGLPECFGAELEAGRLDVGLNSGYGARFILPWWHGDPAIVDQEAVAALAGFICRLAYDEADF